MKTIIQVLLFGKHPDVEALKAEVKLLDQLLLTAKKLRNEPQAIERAQPVK